MTDTPGLAHLCQDYFSRAQHRPERSPREQHGPFDDPLRFTSDIDAGLMRVASN